MLTADSKTEASGGAALLLSDSRWQLILRIVDSKVFNRCEQLQKLLLYVSEKTIKGLTDEISEQQIGVVVYKRSLSFDSAADTIVRSHASRLRQKLDSYFRTEGQFETLRINIPRGGYIPEFHAAESDRDSDLKRHVDRPLLESAREELNSQKVEQALPSDGRRVPAGTSKFVSFRTMLLVTLVASVLSSSVVLVFIKHLRARDEPQAHAPLQTAIEEKFWKAVLPAEDNEKTLLVIGDSGLSLYESLTGTDASLEDYVDGEFRPGDSSVPQTALTKVALELSSHRYTSVVDAELVEKVTHLNQWSERRDSMVFARDLRAADAAKSNLILLGSRQGNPWLALAEPALNFVLVPDGMHGFQYLNKKPAPKEQATYAFSDNHGTFGAASVYGYIAYLRNPGSQKRILVLSGMWVSGTQSAGNFALDSPHFSDWLSSIKNADGTIPSFELLLSTKSLQGNATYTAIAASRVYRE